MKNLIMDVKERFEVMRKSKTQLQKTGGKYQQVRDDHNWKHRKQADLPYWDEVSNFGPNQDKAWAEIRASQDLDAKKRKAELAEARATNTEEEYWNFIQGIAERYVATNREREIEQRFKDKRGTGRTTEEMRDHLMRVAAEIQNIKTLYKKKTGDKFPEKLPEYGDLNEGDTRNLPMEKPEMLPIIHNNIELELVTMIYKKALGEYPPNYNKLYEDEEFERALKDIAKRAEKAKEKPKAKPRQEQQKKKQRPRPAPKTGVLAEALELFEMKQPFTAKELSSRRRKLLAKTHPDQGGSAFLFKQVETAHEILKRHTEG